LALPQWAHALSADVDGDDDKLTAVTDFGDDFAGVTFERGTLDDVLGFPGRTVSLTLDDLPREDDVFKIEDGELVIFKFVCGVGGNDLAERADQMAKVGDGHLGHAQVYESAQPARQLRVLFSDAWSANGPVSEA
jgi:hypothetical protein